MQTLSLVLLPPSPMTYFIFGYPQKQTLQKRGSTGCVGSHSVGWASACCSVGAQQANMKYLISQELMQAGCRRSGCSPLRSNPHPGREISSRDRMDSEPASKVQQPGPNHQGAQYYAGRPSCKWAAQSALCCLPFPIIHHTSFWAAEMAPEERSRANTAPAPLQVHAFWGQGDKVNEADLEASTESKGLVRPYRGGSHLYGREGGVLGQLRIKATEPEPEGSRWAVP